MNFSTVFSGFQKSCLRQNKTFFNPAVTLLIQKCKFRCWMFVLARAASIPACTGARWKSAVSVGRSLVYHRAPHKNTHKHVYFVSLARGRHGKHSTVHVLISSLQGHMTLSQTTNKRQINSFAIQMTMTEYKDTSPALDIKSHIVPLRCHKGP